MKYDDASWHYGGDFPADLPTSAGATHIGLFLAWMLINGFASEELVDDAAEEITQVRSRDLDGRAFLLQILDEKLSEADFNDEGNAFALAYYQGQDNSRFYCDYEKTLAPEPGTIYRVENSWSNYDRLAPVLDRRLATWRATGRPQYID
ncbi:hypothetical protein GGD92_07585 [Pseudomonas protegens]|uniref:DUF7832 domain-containing protein n=1 Tax=Pseudomonas protegens TaxID=380021 RepID=A0A7G8YR16_9PSED|nr:hypothetical protein [Pseudomonas protegens]QNH78114.1 hypothetical protein GGI48_02660 [Pseudomonas protegens]QNL07310.1 hypothetical protein GGD92_07585 [Pseudomonas protegens]